MIVKLIQSTQSCALVKANIQFQILRSLWMILKCLKLFRKWVRQKSQDPVRWETSMHSSIYPSCLVTKIDQRMESCKSVICVTIHNVLQSHLPSFNCSLSIYRRPHCHSNGIRKIKNKIYLHKYPFLLKSKQDFGFQQFPSFNTWADDRS